MAKPRYSPAAIRDLEQIGDYIADELKNPSAALKTVGHILDAVDKPAGAPGVGAPFSAHYENVDNYRYLVCGNYLVFYREQSDGTYIDRVLYGKMDYIAILFGKLPEEIE